MACITETATAGTFMPDENETQTLRRTGVSVGNALGMAVARIADSIGALRTGARRIKEEKPLHLLGVIAGLALAGGLATRLWRANHA